MVQATSAKFGLHVANMKFNTQHEEEISIHTIVCTLLLVYFSIHVQQTILTITEKFI
jgi:hypothetical protein